MTETPQASAVVKICNRRGLHARAAAKFVRLAEETGHSITVSKGNVRVPGNSIMGLLLLAASYDSEIEISATGPDADSAIATLSALISRRFDEEI